MRKFFVACLLLAVTLVLIILQYGQNIAHYEVQQYGQNIAHIAIQQYGFSFQRSQKTVGYQKFKDGKITRRHQNPKDPDWYGASLGDYHMYAYSALYDNRNITGRPRVPHIVVLGLWQKTGGTIYCGFWNDTEILNVSAATLIISRYAGRPGPCSFKFIIHCPCPKLDRFPQFVSLDSNRQRLVSKHLLKVPVELPRVPEKKGEFVVCVNDRYHITKETVDEIQPRGIVEWVEMVRLLGADHIAVYNHSMTPEVAKVFHYYEKQGFVQIFSKSLLPIDQTLRKPDRVLGLNDCLYRHMHSYKIIIIDTDELIASYSVNNFQELLVEIALKANVDIDNSLFTFRNQRYFVDDPRVVPGPLVTQFAVRHTSAENPGERTKMIVDPNLCLVVNCHKCWHKQRNIN